MPLSPEGVAPCNWCIDAEMYRIAKESGDSPNVQKVNLAEITKTSRYCIKCGLPFCPEHASPVDQVDACVRCLPFEDISEMRTRLVSQDENGTHFHKGYRVVPTGAGYKTLPKAISDLDDGELEQFIKDKQNQVAEVELRRDYLRTALSTAKIEKNEREIAVQRQLRGIKVKLPVADPNKGIKITGQKGTGPVKGVAGVGGQPLDLAAFLKFAASYKKSNVAGTAAPAAPPSASGVGSVTTKSSPAVAGGNKAVTAEKGEAVQPAASPEVTTERDKMIENIFEEEEGKNAN